MYTIKEMQNLASSYGISYGDLAGQCKLSLSTIQKALGGINKRPRMTTLEELSKAFDRVLTRVDGRSPYESIMHTQTEKHSQADYRDALSTMPHGSVAEQIVFRSGGTSALDGTFGGKDSTQKGYTYEDYENLQLPEGKRVEVIDGVIYDMSGPSIVHQEVIGYMYRRFCDFFDANHGACRVLLSPLDVRLEYDSGDMTVVQPDLVVICDRSRIDKMKSIKGAPDFVLEVLSPSSRKMDLNIKMQKYRKSGVREYWVIDPFALAVIKTVFEGEESTSLHTFDDEIPVAIYDGKLKICLKPVKQYIDEE